MASIVESVAGFRRGRGCVRYRTNSGANCLCSSAKTILQGCGKGGATRLTAGNTQGSLAAGRLGATSDNSNGNSNSECESSVRSERAKGASLIYRAIIDCVFQS